LTSAIEVIAGVHLKHNCCVSESVVGPGCVKTLKNRKAPKKNPPHDIINTKKEEYFPPGQDY
jgi:hypothetical protein